MGRSGHFWGYSTYCRTPIAITWNQYILVYMMFALEIPEAMDLVAFVLRYLVFLEFSLARLPLHHLVADVLAFR